MITRERLIAALHELIHVEESAVTIYANFSKALVRETPDIEKAKKEAMLKLLSELYRDSSRHREIVTALIAKVEQSQKNEY